MKMQLGICLFAAFVAATVTAAPYENYNVDQWQTECVVGQEFALDHKNGECSQFKCKFLEDCSPECWISYDDCPDEESQVDEDGDSDADADTDVDDGDDVETDEDYDTDADADSNVDADDAQGDEDGEADDGEADDGTAVDEGPEMPELSKRWIVNPKCDQQACLDFYRLSWYRRPVGDTHDRCFSTCCSKDRYQVLQDYKKKNPDHYN